MTIETYYNFLKIVECGTISSAAQELLVAQPALSTQLKNLETSLGVTLVDRNAKKITLTPAGELFYKKAQIICSLDDSIHKDLEDYMEGNVGTLHISMTPTNPASILHSLFDHFVETHPDVKFQFRESLSNQIADDVRNGISEIGIIRSRIKNPEDFHIMPHSKEHLSVIVSNNHPLAQYDSISLKQLVHEPIATTAMIAPTIEKAFQSIGQEPNFYLTVSQRRTALFWLNHYKNCVVILYCLPEELPPDAPDCKLLTVNDYDFTTQRSIIISRNRPLSPLAKEFLSSIHMEPAFPDVL